MNRLRVAVLFGSRSGEHEVSLRSADAVVSGLEEAGVYDVLPVGISREGKWFLGSRPPMSPQEGVRVAILPDPSVKGLYILDGKNAGEIIPVDVVFPVLHGPYGEDGTMQGLLELAGLPYVGSGVLGSAVSLDKAVMKSILRDAGLPVGDYMSFTVTDWEESNQQIKARIEDELGYPCFVKPANMGSSVGISKVKDSSGLERALREAFRYDRKVVVEKTLYGREIECSVLGNERPRVSVPGEVIPSNEFYDYNAKYLDGRSGRIIPADLTAEQTGRVQELAMKVFAALDCSGLGRVDFFVNDEDNDIRVIEINTLPGFTVVGMYPKLWKECGLPLPELLQELIELALVRFREKEDLQTVYSCAS